MRFRSPKSENPALLNEATAWNTPSHAARGSGSPPAPDPPGGASGEHAQPRRPGQRLAADREPRREDQSDGRLDGEGDAHHGEEHGADLREPLAARLGVDRQLRADGEAAEHGEADDACEGGDPEAAELDEHD